MNLNNVVRTTIRRNALWLLRLTALLRFVLVWITASRVLTLLALGWGGFVFYVLRAAAFDSGTGYPHTVEILPFTVPAALPLLVGAFVVNIKKGWGKYVRWLCALPLLAQAAILLYFAFKAIMLFMVLAALPPLFGTLLLLWMEMTWCFNQIRSLIPLKVCLKLLQLRLLLTLIGIGISGVILGYRWTHNPLESDAEMIAHFKAHQGDFEYLANRFRTLPDDGQKTYAESSWHKSNESPEIWAIKKRSNIKYVHWSGLTLSPEQSIQVPIDEGKYNKNTAIRITLENQKNSTSFLHYCTSMEKSYVNFPVEPRIEQGQLVFSMMRENILGQEKQPKRVADSLDGYPPGLKEQEYVYRRIEANWFIELRGSCK